MNYRSALFSVVTLVGSCSVFAQRTLSIEECIALAKQNNTSVKLAREIAFTKEEVNKLTRKNNLPKVDFIAGYNHLGDNIEVNLQQVRGSIIEGTATQSVNAANQVYQEWTGNPLSATVQNAIYQTSKDIIGAVYPNYNPLVAKQDYFLAGLFVRQPIYLGGKLKAAQELAQQQSETSKVGIENAEDLVSYNLILQYLQVQYLNSMIDKQVQIVEAHKKNQSYAANLLKSEIIPPYQKKYADAALIQAETTLNTLNLEKQNALLTIKQLSGMDLNENIDIADRLPENINYVNKSFSSDTNNTDLRILNSKKEEANIALKAAKAGNYPNIFAIGNLQFLRKDLPIITPPWLVGIELQWTLFDGFENRNKVKIAESLVKESEMLIQQKTEAVNLATRISKNKMEAFADQSKSLDNARQESYTTTEMVRKRMENSLSSVKDVNDALKFQYEMEKAYYTSVVGYQTAVATYYYLVGTAEKSLNVIK